MLSLLVDGPLEINRLPKSTGGPRCANTNRGRHGDRAGENPIADPRFEATVTVAFEYCLSAR